MVIDGIPGLLACMIYAEDGMTIERQQAYPAPPVLTGHEPERRELAPSVLVVGGGPAGMSVASTIAESGVDVALIDERSRLGGQFYKQPAKHREINANRLDHQYRAGRELIARVHAAGVDVIAGASIWGAFSPNHLMAAGEGISWTLRPHRLVLATGAQERAVPIPGWTLPGVMLTGAAQTLLRSSQVSPGRRILISGNGPLNMQLAAELLKAGVEVAALVEQADLRWWTNSLPGAGMAVSAPELVRRGVSYRTTLAREGVPVLDRSSVVAIHGKDRVEAVTVASVGKSGARVAGTEKEFAVDAVCLGYGFIPSNEIPRALGCDHHIDPNGTLETTKSITGRSSLETVWVVGDAGGVQGAYVAQARGEIAGFEILEDLGVSPSGRALLSLRRAQRLLSRHRRFQKSLAVLYDARPLTTELAEPDTTICRCESVSLRQLAQSFSDGSTSAGASKRVTRAGMGKCQGRYCSQSIIALAAATGGVQIEEFSGFAPQAPVRPTEIGLVADSIIETRDAIRTKAKQEPNA
jgi:NADPH-dependent 2,4-dienoyl-CoA reductase/sulfur reductase-like enzyme